jgi:hypothetical protein
MDDHAEVAKRLVERIHDKTTPTNEIKAHFAMGIGLGGLFFSPEGLMIAYIAREELVHRGIPDEEIRAALDGIVEFKDKPKEEKRAGFFWPYGIKAVKCWASEAKANRLQIAGAVVVVSIVQVVFFPMEIVRIVGQRFRRKAG